MDKPLDGQFIVQGRRFLNKLVLSDTIPSLSVDNLLLATVGPGELESRGGTTAYRNCHSNHCWNGAVLACWQAHKYVWHKHLPLAAKSRP